MVVKTKKVPQPHGGKLEHWPKGTKPPTLVKHKGDRSARTIFRDICKAIGKGKNPFTGELMQIDGKERLAYELLNIALFGEKDSDRIGAIKEILEILEGKNRNQSDTPIEIQNQQINIFLDGNKIDLSK